MKSNMQHEAFVARTYISFPDLINALILKKLLKIYDVTYRLPILPKSSYTFNRRVDNGSIYIIFEETYAVSRDNSLQIFTYIDGELRKQDSSLTQQIYSIPSNWINMGILVTARTSIVNEIMNTSDETVYLTISTKYGSMPREIFDEVVSKYYDMIFNALIRK